MPEEKKKQEEIPAAPVLVDVNIPPKIEATPPEETEEAEEAPEIVPEEVEEHETKETPVERGYDQIMARLDGIEDRITKITRPEPKPKPQPKPKTEEIKEDVKTEEKPAERKSRKLKLFK